MLNIPLPVETVFNSFPVKARTKCSPYAAAGLVKRAEDVWFYVMSSRFTKGKKGRIILICLCLVKFNVT